MTAPFAIAGRSIGPDEPVYVIAEVSANHGQDYDTAARIVRGAAEAGADAVKLQTYTPDTITIASNAPAFRAGEGSLWEGTTLYDLYQKAYMPWDWQPRLKALAEELGLHCFSSPFDPTAVEFLLAMDVPAFKIASFELVDLPLIAYAAQTGLPVILSTGMATYGEIEDALGAVSGAGNDQVALLRCASVYPAEPEIMNLRAMATLRDAFGVPVGPSDHTRGIAVAAAAAALGAELVEKHFTLSRELEGPDHPFALEPGELKAMVAGIREAEAALGSGRLEGPSEAESGEMYQLARRSVIAATDIPAGTVITEEMLAVKRPGYGIKPRDLPILVGRTAKVDIEFDDVITWEMV